MSTLILYLIMKADSLISMVSSIHWILVLLVYGSVILWVLAWICQGVNVMDDDYSDKKKEEQEAENKSFNGFRTRCFMVFKYTFPFYLFGLLTIGLLPTTKQMAALYVLPKAINSETGETILKTIPSKIVNLGDEWLDELSPAKVLDKADSVINETKDKVVDKTP